MLQQHVGTTSAASVGGRRLNVPRWARAAAYVVPLLTVPSGLWRLALALDVPGMPDPGQPAGQRLYMVFLSLLAEGLALLTLGLVQPWGEVLPRWIPLLGRRRIPPLAAVIPAALGAAGVTTIVAYAAYNAFVRGMIENLGTPGQQRVVAACYAPLVAWGPLLGAVTVAYYRRRRGGGGPGAPPPVP
jgi:hypothetical protein